MPAQLPDSIRMSLPYLLARAHHRQIDIFEKHTQAFAVAPREFATMLLLEAHQDLWQSQIAETLHLDRTTVTYLVDGMEKRGWLARRRDPADRRAHVVNLTNTGQQALADIKPAVCEARKALLAPLSTEEQKLLCTLLARLTKATP